jgi:hypothetical protein
MPPQRTTASKPRQPESVAAFLAALDHPLKPVLTLVRTTILGTSPKIIEGIKWNAPSFRLRDAADYFATLNIHGTAKGSEAVLVVLHTGVKARAAGARGLSIEDPAGLLQWLGKDRGVVRFPNAKMAKASQAAFRAIVRQWIGQL